MSRLLLECPDSIGYLELYILGGNRTGMACSLSDRAADIKIAEISVWDEASFCPSDPVVEPSREIRDAAPAKYFYSRNRLRLFCSGLGRAQNHKAHKLPHCA